MTEARMLKVLVVNLKYERDGERKRRDKMEGKQSLSRTSQQRGVGAKRAKTSDLARDLKGNTGVMVNPAEQMRITSFVDS